jgi:hypothetical protein
MSNPNPNRASVRRSLFRGKKVPELLATLLNTCNAGAASADVQGSPIASQALKDLQGAVGVATTSQGKKLKAQQDLKSTAKDVRNDIQATRVALYTYETAVNGLAGGDAAVINKAGLASRDESTGTPTLDVVAKVTSTAGKHPRQATLRWPEAAGATGYAAEVNFTPDNPAGPWTSLGTGSRRSRAVLAPTPGAQFLARVAAVASDGTPSAWSPVILGTAR